MYVPIRPAAACRCAIMWTRFCSGGRTTIERLRSRKSARYASSTLGGRRVRTNGTRVSRRRVAAVTGASSALRGEETRA